MAAHLVSRDDECETVTARAHQDFSDRGDREGAARAAFWLGFSLLQRGARAPASGWFARAGRLLDEGQRDNAVRGYLLIPVAITHIAQGVSQSAAAILSGRGFDAWSLTGGMKAWSLAWNKAPVLLSETKAPRCTIWRALQMSPRAEPVDIGDFTRVDKEWSA